MTKSTFKRASQLSYSSLADIPATCTTLIQFFKPSLGTVRSMLYVQLATSRFRLARSTRLQNIKRSLLHSADSGVPTAFGPGVRFHTFHTNARPRRAQQQQQQQQYAEASFNFTQAPHSFPSTAPWSRTNSHGASGHAYSEGGPSPPLIPAGAAAAAAHPHALPLHLRQLRLGQARRMPAPAPRERAPPREHSEGGPGRGTERQRRPVPART